MAVFTTEIPTDWSEICDPRLTDDEAEAFLEALEATNGNAKAACRAVGVSRGAAGARKRIDEKFSDEWNWIRRCNSPLCVAGDELFMSLDALESLVGAEAGLDHLINVAFDPCGEPPVEPKRFDPAVLKAARDRVEHAGLAWAIELVKATGYLDREVKEALERKLAARRERNRRQREKRAARGGLALESLAAQLDVSVDEAEAELERMLTLEGNGLDTVDGEARVQS